LKKPPQRRTAALMFFAKQANRQGKPKSRLFFFGFSVFYRSCLLRKLTHPLWPLGNEHTIQFDIQFSMPTGRHETSDVPPWSCLGRVSVWSSPAPEDLCFKPPLPQSSSSSHHHAHHTPDEVPDAGCGGSLGDDDAIGMRALSCAGSGDGSCVAARQ